MNSLFNNCLADELHKSLVDSMKSRSFSLLMDETTDIGTEQQASLMARLFDEDTNHVCSFFNQLVTVENADSEGLF